MYVTDRPKTTQICGHMPYDGGMRSALMALLISAMVSCATNAGRPGKSPPPVDESLADAQAEEPPAGVMTVSIAPAEPRTTDPLTAVVSLPDSDAGITYRWTRNGSLIDVTTPVMLPEETSRGDVFEVQTATWSGLSATAQVSIANSEPAVSAVFITPVDPIPGQLLSCEAAGAFDPDDDAVTFSFAWTVDGEPVNGPDGSVFGANELTRGDVVVCTVTPTDGDLTGEPVASEPVELGNRPPSLGSVTLSPATGNTLTIFECVAADPQDPDGDAVTLTYDWSVNGEQTDGADTPVFAAEQLARGDVLVCTVTPSDGDMLGDAVSSAGAVIANTPPAVGSVLVLGDDPAALTCEAYDVVDPDDDETSVAITWLVNGVEVETVDAAALKKGDVVSCSAVASDADGPGEPTFSKNSVHVGNHAPGAPEVAIEPAVAEAGEPLTCSIAAPAVDQDDDPLTYELVWYATDIAADPLEAGEPEFAGADLPPDVTQDAQTWSCAATAFDGEEHGPPGVATVEITEPAPLCETMEDYTQQVWPSGSAGSKCVNSKGKTLPKSGPGAATWFNYGGCGSWKTFPAIPDVLHRLRATGDSCGGCMLWHVGFHIQEDFGAGWETVETHDPPDKKGMKYEILYTPKTDEFRIQALGGFYIKVYLCPE